MTTRFAGSPLRELVLGALLAALVQIARRARYLWLLEPSRDRIFSVVERVTVSIWLRMAIFTALLLVGFHVAVAPLTVERLIQTFGLLCGTMVLGSYLALFATRGLSVLIVIAWFALCAGSVLFAVALITAFWSAATIMLVVLAELASALALRMVARRRWQVVDFTAFKPLDWSTATLRS